MEMTSRRALDTSVSGMCNKRDTCTNTSVGVSVDNLTAACQRFEDLNCNWKKRLTDGRMKSVAFLLDPDGYWVEIVQNDLYGDANVEGTN